MKTNLPANLIGPLSPPIEHIDKSLFTVFVDGGLSFREEGFADSLAIGDGDSSSQAMDIKLPRDKDRGDLHFACALLAQRGFANAKLYGFWGGRLDHQLLLLGDLFEAAESWSARYQLYEGNQLRVEIIPPGKTEFFYEGKFSVFSLKTQSVEFGGDCEYPKRKEYPQLMKPLSTLGLSNYSRSGFSLNSPGALAIYYIPPED